MAAYSGPQQQESTWGKMFKIAGKAVKYTLYGAAAVGAALIGADVIGHIAGSPDAVGNFLKSTLEAVGLDGFFGIGENAATSGIGVTIADWAGHVDEAIGSVVGTTKDGAAYLKDNWKTAAAVAGTGAAGLVVGKYTQKVADERKLAQMQEQGLV